MENTGYSTVGLGDAMLLANQNRDNFGNGGCWWIWIFLLFFLMGGNGFYGNNKGYATQQDVYAAADNQNLMGSIEQVRAGNISLGNGLADLGFTLNGTIQNGFTGAMRDNFGLQQAMMGGFNNVAQAIAENRFTAQSCCCETNRNLDQLRYNSAMETAGINQTATANTQKILDKLCNMEANAKDAEIAALRQQLSNAQLAVSQQAQNATIIQAVRPFPAPAYIVGSPYATNTCNCGLGA